MLIVSLFSHYKNLVYCHFKQTQFIYCYFYPIKKENIFFDWIDWFAYTTTFLPHIKKASSCTVALPVCEKIVIKISTPESNWAGASEIISLVIVVLRWVRIWQTSAASGNKHDPEWMMGVPTPWNKHSNPPGKSKKEQTGRARFIPLQLQCDIRCRWRSHFSRRRSRPFAQTWQRWGCYPNKLCGRGWNDQVNSSRLPYF